MRTIDGIVVQVFETSALVCLRIVALLQQQVNILLVGILVGLGLLQHLLQKFQGGRHVLIQTGKRDGEVVVIDVDAVAAGEFIELSLDVGSRQLLRAHIF